MRWEPSPDHPYFTVALLHLPTSLCLGSQGQQLLKDYLGHQLKCIRRAFIDYAREPCDLFSISSVSALSFREQECPRKSIVHSLDAIK